MKYFLHIVDQALSSLQSQFEQFQVYEKTFRFLFDLKDLNATNDEALMSYCVNLETFLSKDVLSDIDGRDLFSELKVLKEVLPKETTKPIDVLNYLKVMDVVFPIHGLHTEYC